MPFLTTALVAGGLAAAGGIGGAAISANAAGNAASTQSKAATSAAELQYQAEQDALKFQQQVWQQQQQNISPWLQSGAGALSTLDQLMGLNPPNIPPNFGQPQSTNAGAPPNPFPNNPQGTAMPGRGNLVPFNGGATSDGGRGGPISGGGVPVRGTAMPSGTPSAPTGGPGAQAPGIGTGQLVPFSPWTQQFTAPTAEQARETPGYQFQLDQGTKAVQNSAAARGDLLSGNTLADLTQFGQGLADTTYNDTYNRALQQYQQNYNVFENNQANQFNRLSALSGGGQTAASQLNSAGSTAAGNYGNTVIGSTNAIGQNLNNAAAATASGYVGAGNAWGGAAQSLGSLGTLIPYLSMLNGQNAGAPTTGALGVA